MKDKIIGLIVGIRFARSFRIPDISGDIIDNIIYSDKSPFGPEYFPRLQENTRREKTLYNADTSNYLRINTDDLILGITVNNDFDDKYNWIKNDVLNYFKDNLFKKYEIKNIKRIGIIFTHKIRRNQKMNEAIALLTGKTITDVENISISFSKKAPSSEALYRKGVNDYKNTIYNFDEIEDVLHASLDYQYYYEPGIEDLRECFSEKVFEDAKRFLENNYYPWLNAYETQQNK